MFIIRKLLAAIILFLNWLFTPKSLERDTNLQQAIDKQTEQLTLFQYKACPFCVKVRRCIKRLNLTIQTTDIRQCEASREELMKSGGSLKVPCLRITDDNGNTQWMYESLDIMAYLEKRFA